MLKIYFAPLQVWIKQKVSDLECFCWQKLVDLKGVYFLKEQWRWKSSSRNKAYLQRIQSITTTISGHLPKYMGTWREEMSLDLAKNSTVRRLRSIKTPSSSPMVDAAKTVDVRVGMPWKKSVWLDTAFCNDYGILGFLLVCYWQL